MIILPNISETLMLDLETLKASLSEDTDDHVLNTKDLTFTMEDISSPGSTEEEFEVHLKTSSGNDWKFSRRGLEDFCTVISYPTKNFSVLNDKNILDDIRYRLSQMAAGDKKIIVRHDNDYKTITHCYAIKGESSGSPLFDSDLVDILDNCKCFKDLTFYSALRNKDVTVVILKDSNLKFTFNGDEYTLGVLLKSDQSCSKAHFLAEPVVLSEDNIMFIEHGKVSSFVPMELARSVTSKTIKDFYNSVDLGVVDLQKDLVDNLEVLKEAKITSQKVGFLFRKLKGVGKKYKQMLFDGYMMTLDDEMTEEPLSTEVLEKSGMSVFELLNRSANMCLLMTQDTDSPLRISEVINLGEFAGFLFSPRNYIFNKTKF